MRTLDPARTTDYRAAMTITCLVCGLAVVGSVVPTVEQMVNAGAPTLPNPRPHTMINDLGTAVVIGLFFFAAYE